MGWSILKRKSISQAYIKSVEKNQDKLKNKSEACTHETESIRLLFTIPRPFCTCWNDL